MTLTIELSDKAFTQLELTVDKSCRGYSFVTSDERLVNSVSAAIPEVNALASWP